MKKTISLILCLIFAVASFSACARSITASRIKSSLEYYNQKAISNIDSLIGRIPTNVEDWVYETFLQDEIKEAEIHNEGAGPSYLSRDETVKIFFIIDDENRSLFIEPNDDKYELKKIGKPFVSKNYKQKVKDYCFNPDADYRNAPAICELSLYNFDKADNSTHLVYWYLFNDSDTWGFEGDTGLFAQASFTYNNGEIVKETY